MSEGFFDPVLVQKLVKAAKDKPLNFAFVQAASADQHLLGVDKHKQGAQLMAILKKEAGSAKGCWGTVTCEGGVATFSCDKPLPGLAKLLTEWFRRQKISLKAALAREDETSPAVEEEDEAEEPEAEDKEEEDEADLDDESSKIFTLKYVRAMLKRARAAPANFAFGFGETPEEDLLTLHPRKAALALSRLVKRDNGATRLSFGTLVWEGQQVIFTCEKRPVSGLKKRIRRLFKSWKLPLKPVIFGPDGRFDEDGDEDDEEMGAAVAETARDADGGQLAAIAAALKEVLPQLQELVRANPALADAMRSPYQVCSAALKAGDEAAAGAALEELRRLGRQAQGEATTGAGSAAGELVALSAGLKALLPQLQDLGRANPALVDDLRRRYQACEAAIKAGDARTARTALEELRAIKGASAPAEDPAITTMRAALERRMAEAQAVIAKITDPDKRKDREDLAALHYRACTDALNGGNVDAARQAATELWNLAKAPVDAQAEVRAAKGPLSFDFTRAQVEWAQARRQTIEVVQALQQELRDLLKGEADFAELDREISKLDSAVIGFDDALDTVFTDAINATDHDTKARLKSRAHAQVKSYIEFARTNPYLSKMDSIPGAKITVFADLIGHLSALEKTLA